MKNWNNFIEICNYEFSFLVLFKIFFILIIFILNIILFFKLDTKQTKKDETKCSGFNNRIFSNLLGRSGLSITLYQTYLTYRFEKYNKTDKEYIYYKAEENLNKLKINVSNLKKENILNEADDLKTQEFLNNGVNSFSKLTSLNLELFNLQKKRNQLIEDNDFSKFEAIDAAIRYNLFTTLYLLRDMKLDWKEHSKQYPNNIDSKALSELMVNLKININQIKNIITSTVPEAEIPNMENKASTTLENIDIKPKQSFIFSGLIDRFEELDTMGQLAIALLISKSLLLSSFISIIFIYYGDAIISKYKLNIKYPKLAAVINLRKQFTKYYLIINFLTILFVILSEIIFSIAVLL